MSFKPENATIYYDNDDFIYNIFNTIFDGAYTYEIAKSKNISFDKVKFPFIKRKYGYLAFGLPLYISDYVINDGSNVATLFINTKPSLITTGSDEGSDTEKGLRFMKYSEDPDENIKSNEYSTLMPINYVYQGKNSKVIPCLGRYSTDIPHEPQMIYIKQTDKNGYSIEKNGSPFTIGGFDAPIKNKTKTMFKDGGYLLNEMNNTYDYGGYHIEPIFKKYLFESVTHTIEDNMMYGNIYSNFTLENNVLTIYYRYISYNTSTQELSYEDKSVSYTLQDHEYVVLFQKPQIILNNSNPEFNLDISNRKSGNNNILTGNFSCANEYNVDSPQITTTTIYPENNTTISQNYLNTFLNIVDLTKEIRGTTSSAYRGSENNLQNIFSMNARYFLKCSNYNYFYSFSEEQKESADYYNQYNIFRSDSFLYADLLVGPNMYSYVCDKDSKATLNVNFTSTMGTTYSGQTEATNLNGNFYFNLSGISWGNLLVESTVKTLIVDFETSSTLTTAPDLVVFALYTDQEGNIDQSIGE